MMTAFDLAEFLPYQLAVAAGRISRAYARRYAAVSGLSVPEWRVMAHLSQSGEVSVREINARVDMDKSKVSRAATRLEEKGLVAKTAHDSDRRLVSLSLTPAGEAMMERLIPIALEFQAELQELLGPEVQSFRSGLTTIMEQPI